MSTKIVEEKIPLYSMPSGHKLDLTAYHIQGDKLGPHVHIQASVHGSELQGSLVLFKLLERLKNEEICGSFTLIPLANPLATNNKQSTFTQGRYSQVTGNNWNRLYHDVTPELDFDDCLSEQGDLRQKFKQHLKVILQANVKKRKDYGIPHDILCSSTLQIMAAKADIVLDLHTGPCATEYLYAPLHLKKHAEDLALPFHILIPSEFAGAMDEACFTPWFHFEKHCSEQSREYGAPFEAYTLELGSEEKLCSEQAEKQVQVITSYLSARSILSCEQQSKPVLQQDLSAFKSYHCPAGGLIEYLKKPGEFVKKGDGLYLLHLAHKPCLTIQANQDAYIINHTPSASLIQGSCVYQVLELA
jgi:predicted deacylase